MELFWLAVKVELTGVVALFAAAALSSLGHRKAADIAGYCGIVTFVLGVLSAIWLFQFS